MKTLRAILVDDEPLCRQDLRDVLLAFPHVQICGEAATITEAATLLKKSMPDLIFLDLSLGQEMGFNLLQGRSFPGAVIAVTAHAEHAGQKADAETKRDDDERVHRQVGDGQVKIHARAGLSRTGGEVNPHHIFMVAHQFA